MCSRACVDRDRRPERGPVAGHEAELELEVQPRARAERRLAGVRRRWALPERAAHRCPRDDDRGRAPVVADRQVLPVGQQRVGVRPEHLAEVGRVLDRRVEVDVVRRIDRAHAASPGRAGSSLPRRPRERTASCSARAHRRPGRAAEGEEVRCSVGCGERLAGDPEVERGEVDHVVLQSRRRRAAAPPPVEKTPYGRLSTAPAGFRARDASSTPWVDQVVDGLVERARAEGREQAAAALDRGVVGTEVAPAEARRRRSRRRRGPARR